MALARRSDAAATPARILVVDDVESISYSVAMALRYAGFEVREERTGRAAERAIRSFLPDLIVLDIMLPDLDGLAIARQLHERGAATPVIFLTARDATEEKVAGLSLAEDYITKPFALAEVVARVHVVLRRAAVERQDGELRFGDLMLDEASREVVRGDTAIVLTRTEFELLRYFMLNPRQVLTKAQILENVWSVDYRGETSVVETYISYLRRKLDAPGPSLIKTIRLVGYMLREPAA